MKSRSCVLGGVVVLIAAALASTVAAAEVPPSVAAQKKLLSTTPISCAGSVNVEVKLTGSGGETGAATDVELVLDVSGSLAGQKLADLKNAARSLVEALDVRDGSNDGTLSRGNRAGIVTYAGSSATTAVALGTSESTLTSVINGLSGAAGSSPHAAGITTARDNLAAGTNARAMVLFTDGLTNQSAAASAATTAKNAPYNVRIVSIGIGSDADAGDLQSWASNGATTYQSATPGPIDANELVADLGAARAVHAQFTVIETLGLRFRAGSPSAGTVAPDGKSVTWTGSLGNGETATLTYSATRDGTDVFSVTNEVVSQSVVSVTGGSATITPPGGAVSIDVLPCGATILAHQTCTGSGCSVSGQQNGYQYAVNTGAPPAGTQLFLTSTSVSPPAGVCQGVLSPSGIQLDIRPLTTDGVFDVRIPKSALVSSGLKWWQTDVCLGTNLGFVTKLDSLAVLRPGATLAAGRWWGLLPSIPRYTYASGLGWFRGPWINRRSLASNGDALIRFTVPYVPGSQALTTNGLPGYDPKMFTGP